MARYRVQGPDGKVHVFEGPDGAAPADIEAFAAQTFGNPAQAAAPVRPGLTPEGDSDPEQSPLNPKNLTKQQQQQMLEADMAQRKKTQVLGALRGVSDVGDAVIGGAVKFGSHLYGLAGISKDEATKWNEDRLRQRDAAYSGAVNPDQASFVVPRIAANVAMTAPVGGVLGAGAKGLGATRLGNALASGGFTTGTKAVGFGAKAADLGLRAVGGAVTGGASTALVDPDAAGRGALIGAVAPGVLQVAGRTGQAVYSRFRAPNAKSGRVLSVALDLPEDQLAAVIRAAGDAPDAIVPGSNLTLAQALQGQGANQPSVSMLERVVAGGPGGDVLLNRYRDQGLARLAALEGQGAQVYQGAAREEMTRAGDRLGAILRTQAADDTAATRDAWEALNELARREKVALELPLDAMGDALRPLGRGSVGAGKDAQAVMREAMEIGADKAGAVPSGVSRVGAGEADRTLGQAVRAIGIHPDELKAGGMAGEVRWLRESLKGGRGIVNKNGKRLDALAARMYEDGYLTQPDASELIAKLADEAQGSPVFSTFANPERMAYVARGGEESARAGMILPKPVPFDEFQRLRSSAGELGAKPTVGAREAKVLGDLERLLAGRVDDAAAGNLRPGEVMPQGFRERYETARGMTRADKERYAQTNNIGSILRRPVGQDYALTGDEIFNKLWHGGAGLAGDVANLRRVLSANNSDPALDALRQAILTDAASKTTASGGLGAALPRYVETRMPGLQEALTPAQLETLSNVAKDIRNAEAAAAIPGLRGSDTQAKITRALDAGLLDSTVAKALGNALSVKGLGLGQVRSAAAGVVIQHKGKTMAQLLANPKAAAAALKDAQFVLKLDNPALTALQSVAARSAAPALAGD